MNKRQKKKNKETLLLFGGIHIYIPRGEWRKINRKSGKSAALKYIIEKAAAAYLNRKKRRAKHDTRKGN